MSRPLILSVILILCGCTPPPPPPAKPIKLATARPHHKPPARFHPPPLPVIVPEQDGDSWLIAGSYSLSHQPHIIMQQLDRLPSPAGLPDPASAAFTDQRIEMFWIPHAETPLRDP